MSERLKEGDMVRCPRCKGSGNEPLELIDVFTFFTRWPCGRCKGRGFVRL